MLCCTSYGKILKFLLIDCYDLKGLLICCRMESVHRVLLHEQSLVQETRDPDQRLLVSVNNHRRQLATSLETVKWQVNAVSCFWCFSLFGCFRIVIFTVLTA